MYIATNAGLFITYQARTNIRLVANLRPCTRSVPSAAQLRNLCATYFAPQHTRSPQSSPTAVVLGLVPRILCDHRARCLDNGQEGTTSTQSGGSNGTRLKEFMSAESRYFAASYSAKMTSNLFLALPFCLTAIASASFTGSPTAINATMPMP